MMMMMMMIMLIMMIMIIMIIMIMMMMMKMIMYTKAVIPCILNVDFTLVLGTITFIINDDDDHNDGYDDDSLDRYHS